MADGKIHSRAGHEGPEGEQKYSSTLSLISAPRPSRVTPGKDPVHIV
jgi:hypothetical protein